MARRTAAERADRLAAWRADPRNAGLTPPVDVAPPGADAPRRPSRRQLREVKRLVREHQEELAGLARDELEKLGPIFEAAKAELTEQLRDWIQRTPDGDLRYTAQSYRAALLHAHQASRTIAEALGERLDDATLRAQRLGVRHLEHEVARMSSVFTGTPKRLALDEARVVATGRSFIIPRIDTSAERYRGAIALDIQRRLAIDIVKGASVYETTQRLVEHGGPTGAVALRGKVGDLNAVVEDIPEGLFKRYEFFAERIVRTELSSAYGLTKQDAMVEAKRALPGLKRQWFADGSACAQVCAPMNGQVRGVQEPFSSSRGAIDHSPAHPNCGCTEVPWLDEWAQPAANHQFQHPWEQPERPPGQGAIDESARLFDGHRELPIAMHLAAEGSVVRSLAEPMHAPHGQRTPDALVNGRPTEFKRVDPGASEKTVIGRVRRGLKGPGQARHIVVWARGSGLNEDQANAAAEELLRKYGGRRLDGLRVIGDAFDRSFP